MGHKHKEHVNSFNMKVTKFLLIISFFLISGLDQKGIPIFFLLVIYFYEFIHNFFDFSHPNIFWEGGLLPILVIVTILKLILCKAYKDKYILLLCIITLLFFTLYLSGIFFHDNIKRVISMEFLIPFLIFISSSIYLLWQNFKKEK